MYTVTVPNVIVQTDTVVGCASMRVVGLAEEQGFAVLLTDVDISRALVEGHYVVFYMMEYATIEKNFDESLQRP